MHIKVLETPTITHRKTSRIQLRITFFFSAIFEIRNFEKNNAKRLSSNNQKKKST